MHMVFRRLWGDKGEIPLETDTVILSEPVEPGGMLTGEVVLRAPDRAVEVQSIRLEAFVDTPGVHKGDGDEGSGGVAQLVGDELGDGCVPELDEVLLQGVLLVGFQRLTGRVAGVDTDPGGPAGVGGQGGERRLVVGVDDVRVAVRDFQARFDDLVPVLEGRRGWGCGVQFEGDGDVFRSPGRSECRQTCREHRCRCPGAGVPGVR
ncbi:hypothetical protein ACFXD5_36145 [Streptomyces sp. NPDC059385]|uniref:hypothetical protein n=1 Tax=Streptomyces sp. NPDC059385 TaxID=3346817 RepID=UPI0036BA0DFA